MTGFLLIITATWHGQPLEPAAVGLLFSAEACQVAGVGMVAVLEQTNPGLTATFTCLPPDGEAA